MMAFSQPTVSEEYAQWNAKLLDYTLADGVDEDGRFFLTVRQMLEDEADANAAEQSFIQAVRTEYATLLKRTADPVMSLRTRTDIQNRPLTVALLGLSVLAAERMKRVEYYEHLSVLLQQPQEGSGVRGFVLDSFEEAWHALGAHIRQKHGCYIEEPEYDGHRFVRWPRMHALLRAVDTGKLPRFYKQEQLETRSIASKYVISLFDFWLNSPRCQLTQSGRRACADKVRRPGILRQVIRILEQWDGTVPGASHGRGSGSSRIRAADACLIADILPKGARIMLRTKRPDGFPERIILPGMALIAAGDGYYNDALLPPSWGSILMRGIALTISDADERMRFRLKGAKAFALIDPDKDGVYESTTALRLKVRCGVLCRAADAIDVSAYLNGICRSVPRRTDLTNELPGWVLFHDFVPSRSGVRPPYGLDLLNVDTALLIHPVGGLRLGQAQEWMHGAPPRSIELLGEDIPSEVLINGSPHPISEPVTLKFSEPGFYAIVAGKERYSLRIVEPVLNTPGDISAAGDLFKADEEWLPTLPIAAPTAFVPPVLPSGLHFVGPSLEPVEPPSTLGPGNTRLRHSAQWAIGMVEGRLSVIALRQRPLPPAASTRLSPLWASKIIQAAQGRLGVIEAERSLDSDSMLERDMIRASWQAYLAAAQRVRRSRHIRAMRNGEDTP